MSDYRVYIKSGTESVEVNIPDIYKDPDSETNTDQIKKYLTDDIGINYNDLCIDVKRKGKIKRNCDNYEIIDGDDIYAYKSDKSNEIDITKIKINSGFYNIRDEKYYKHNFKSSDLEIVLNNDEKHKKKIEEILNEMKSTIEMIKDIDDINFIKGLTIFSFSNLHLKDFPFHEINNLYYFGFFNNKHLPVGFSYCYDKINKIYYEGNFSDFNIYNGKSLVLNKNDSYYSSGLLYSNFEQSNKGSRKYLFKNEVYIGSFDKNFYSDSGTLITDIGKYIGLFKNGFYNSYGMMIYKNNDIYVGFWYNGKRSIFGKLKYSNGDYYSGTWYNDKKEVFGSYFDAKGKITYIGSFKDDMRTFINDEYTLIAGNSFYTDCIGDYESSLKLVEKGIDQSTCSCVYDHSHLVLNNFSNKIHIEENNCRQIYYIGHFDFQKQFYGMGKLFYNYNKGIIDNKVSHLNLYSEEFENEKFKGYRCYHCLFESGSPNGFGMINYENGDKYIGNIKNGQVNGNGTLIKNSGERIKAFWVNGNIIDIY